MTNRTYPLCWHLNVSSTISLSLLCPDLTSSKFSVKKSRFCKKWTLNFIKHPRFLNLSIMSAQIIIVWFFHIAQKLIRSKLMWRGRRRIYLSFMQNILLVRCFSWGIVYGPMLISCFVMPFTYKIWQLCKSLFLTKDYANEFKISNCELDSCWSMSNLVKSTINLFGM